MRNAAIGIALALALALPGAATGLGETSPVVQTGAGALAGVEAGGVVAFKGVPFAAAPTGERRWRAPRPAAPWPGVRRAGAFGAPCIQAAGQRAQNGADPGTPSEDCLFLNIWTPRPEASAGLPVIVWIHGGAYLLGSGGVALYDGAPLARRGAVVVTLNYRRGALGFFAHPALEREDPGGPANFGLLDQIAALRWVRDNIARFGGDPGRVTLIGQSAGAKSVLALFASPLARGLFARGVALSSYGLPDNPRAKAIAIGAKAAQALGLAGAEATAAQLRAVPARRFAELRGAGLSNAPVPISGDPVLPQPITAVFAAGAEAPLPLIVGDTSDDASVVAAFGVDSAAMLQRLGAARLLARALYPGVHDPREVARQAVRDLVFTMPAWSVANRHARLAPTWRYYFDYTAAGERAARPDGVPHGGDVGFWLGTADRAGRGALTEADRAFMRHAGDYLVSFARDGTPASPGAPDWPSHRRARDRILILGDPIAARADFMKPRLEALFVAGAVAGSRRRPAPASSAAGGT